MPEWSFTPRWPRAPRTEAVSARAVTHADDLLVRAGEVRARAEVGVGAEVEAGAEVR